jgi:hypothetical protein
MDAFVYNAHPARVIFGSGTLERLPEEVKRMGLSRAHPRDAPAESDARALVQRTASSRRRHRWRGAHTPVTVTEQACRSSPSAASMASLPSAADRRWASHKPSVRTDLPQTLRQPPTPDQR